MKKLSFYLLTAGFLLSLNSCTSDDSPSTVSANPQPVINTATSGEWVVTYYFDDTDETAHFNGYTFTFSANNVITATNGTNTYTGSWSVTNDHSGGDDDSGHHDDSNDLDFNISFSSPANFAELTDDWDIISYSANKIQLIDVSGGNGGTDYLTFEKN